MHYLTVAIMPDEVKTYPEACGVVQSILDPHWEAEGENENGIWDWFQVGGRWTGYYSEYEPDKDPANWDPDRKEVKWPTDWRKFEGDLVPVRHILNGAASLKNCHLPVYVFFPDGRVVGHWDRAKRQDIESSLVGAADKLALVVDIHS